MPRPVERIDIMIDLLRQAWHKRPDQRLGQLVGNAARKPMPGWPVGRYRDPFNVEDDEVWAALDRMAQDPEWNP